MQFKTQNDYITDENVAIHSCRYVEDVFFDISSLLQVKQIRDLDAGVLASSWRTILELLKASIGNERQ